MSYILEALKKSDQQRQRGATPTLPVGQVMVVAPKQHFSVYYGLLAAVLLRRHLNRLATPVAARATCSCDRTHRR
jgi:hypothetical protein